MDKAAIGLQVADGKRLEASGPAVDMVVALERRIDRKITRRILAVFCAGFGSAEGDRNEMDATPVSWRKRERESFLACSVEKQLVGVVAQNAGSAVDLRRRYADRLPVPARPRHFNVRAR